MFNNLNKKIEIIVIANVILFTMSVILLRLNIVDLWSLLGVNKFYVLNQLQIYRVFTYGFMHADILHIGLNMLALISLSNIVLYFTSEKFMVRTYFISLIASGLGIVFFTNENAFGITVGASGAIYGLFGVLIYYAVKYYRQGNKQLLNSLITTIILNLAISFAPNVSMQGHLTGLVTGIILAFINDHYTKFRK